MSDQSRIKLVTYGLHASTTDFSTAASTLLQIAPEKAEFRSPDRERLARNAMQADGRYVAPLAGRKKLEDAALETILTGMNGNTGGAVTALTACDMGPLLQSNFGTTWTNPSGAATTTTGTSDFAAGTLQVTLGTNIIDGMAILFPTSTGTFIREVASGGGSGASATLTFDRAFTGTVSAAQTIIRAPYLTVSTSTHMHTHLHFRVEGENQRRDFYGCAGTAKLMCAIGDYIRVASSWKVTDITDSAEANPSVSLATTGDAVPTINSTFWIGGTPYLARDLEIDFGGSVNPRTAHAGPQGVQGYVHLDKLPKISGKLYRGTSSLGEIADSTGTPSVNSGQGWDKTPGQALPTFDIGIQFGTAAAGACYVRAPAAHFEKFEMSSTDGLETIDFELACDAPASGSPLRFHLF
jgi:hypothetical protein